MEQKDQPYKNQFNLLTLNRDFLWASGALQMAVATYPGSTITHILYTAQQLDKTFTALLKTCECDYTIETTDLQNSAYIGLIEKHKLDHLLTHSSFEMYCLNMFAADCNELIAAISRILVTAGALKSGNCLEYVNTQMEANAVFDKYEYFHELMQYIEKTYNQN